MQSFYIYIYIFLCAKSSAANETPKVQDELLNRMNVLENKVAEQEAVIAEQRLTNQHQAIILRELEMKVMERSYAPCPCKDMKTETSPLKRFVVDDEGPVAFTAAIAPRVVNDIKDQETIKFETIITSIGGGYNNLTGVFVAPMSGIYVFSCSLMDHVGDHLATNGAMVHGEIVHNQRVLGRIFAHATLSYRDQGAQTVYAQLNQGDQVWVRSIENPDLGLGGDLYSTFSGYLLQAV